MGKSVFSLSTTTTTNSQETLVSDFQNPRLESYDELEDRPDTGFHYLLLADGLDSESQTTMLVRTPSKMEASLPWATTPPKCDPDRRLWDYFTSRVAHSFTLLGPVARTWSDRIPQLAVAGDNLYLFHALLAVSAAARVSRCPADFESLNQSNIQYGRCLSMLRNLDMKAPGTNASAALATTMLLCWYEVSQLIALFLTGGSFPSQRTP